MPRVIESKSFPTVRGQGVDALNLGRQGQPWGKCHLCGRVTVWLCADCKHPRCLDRMDEQHFNCCITCPDTSVEGGL